MLKHQLGLRSSPKQAGRSSHTHRFPTQGPTLRLAWTTPSPDRDRRLGRLPLVLCWVPSPRICGRAVVCRENTNEGTERRLAHAAAQQQHTLLSRRNILPVQTFRGSNTGSLTRGGISDEGRVVVQLARKCSRALDVFGSGGSRKTKRMHKNKIVAPLFAYLRRCLTPTLEQKKVVLGIVKEGMPPPWTKILFCFSQPKVRPAEKDLLSRIHASMPPQACCQSAGFWILPVSRGMTLLMCRMPTILRKVQHEEYRRKTSLRAGLR